MKVLLVGCGNIGLGFVLPIFRRAGYDVTGTDANADRLAKLQRPYRLQTPTYIAKFLLPTVPLDKVRDRYDLIVTAVGRKNLGHVSAWYQQHHISAPVMLAENLPIPVTLFPEQIPAVVDRICPRVEEDGDCLIVVAERRLRFTTIKHDLTHKFCTAREVRLCETLDEMERAQQIKLFTVNTAHVITAIYGLAKRHAFVEKAIMDLEVARRVQATLYEVAQWLKLSANEVARIGLELVTRFSSPIKDPLSRLVSPSKLDSAKRYLDIPLNAIEAMGDGAPTLLEARSHLEI